MQRIICIYIVCLIFIPTSTSLVIPSAYLHIHLQCIPIQDMPRCQDRFQRIQEQSNYLASFVPWILNLPDFSLGKRQTHNFFSDFFPGFYRFPPSFLGLAICSKRSPSVHRNPPLPRSTSRSDDCCGK